MHLLQSYTTRIYYFQDLKLQLHNEGERRSSLPSLKKSRRLLLLFGYEIPCLHRSSQAVKLCYERDEMEPSIEVAAKMAELLGVSLDYLAGETDVLLNKQDHEPHYRDSKAQRNAKLVLPSESIRYHQRKFKRNNH